MCRCAAERDVGVSYGNSPPADGAAPSPAREDQSPSPTKWGRWRRALRGGGGGTPPRDRPPQTGGQNPAAQLPRKAGRARRRPAMCRSAQSGTLEFPRKLRGARHDLRGTRLPLPRSGGGGAEPCEATEGEKPPRRPTPSDRRPKPRRPAPPQSRESEKARNVPLRGRAGRWSFLRKLPAGRRRGPSPARGSSPSPTKWGRWRRALRGGGGETTPRPTPSDRRPKPRRPAPPQSRESERFRYLSGG